MVKSRARFLKVAFLILLIAAEIVLVYKVGDRIEDRVANIGYLFKVDKKFFVAWRETDEWHQSASFNSVSEATQFFSENLNLKPRVTSLLPLEYLRLDERSGDHVVLWKLEENNLLHRLTFKNRNDATYFARHIRSGAYLPSPFGHAIFLSR